MDVGVNVIALASFKVGVEPDWPEVIWLMTYTEVYQNLIDFNIWHFADGMWL